jgi:hypothetical protein
VDAVFYPVALNVITMKKKQKKAKKRRPAIKPTAQNERLKGWNEIASFLGQPVAVAQRWARSGMPVTREGRFMYASREELSGYLGREVGLDVPVHIATENMDLFQQMQQHWERQLAFRPKAESKHSIHSPLFRAIEAMLGHERLRRPVFS